MLDTYRCLFEDYMNGLVGGSLPAGMTLHFIDDWWTYHVKEGEVHCGTNERRDFPPAGTPKWWE